MGSVLTVPEQSVLVSAGVLLVTGLLAVLSRLAVVGARRLRGARLPPIVLHGEAGDGHPLVDRLAAALVDGTTRRILAPGTGAADGQESSTQLPDTPQGAWLAALMRLVRPTPVTYHVHLAGARGFDDPAGRAEVTVHIVREPGKAVIAAEVLRGDDESDLVEKVACLCAVQVHNQPDVQRRIPRWERWGDDPRGYEHFRLAMRLQKELADASPAEPPANGQPVRMPGIGQVRDALDLAARHAPANLTLRLNEAAVEELYPHTDPRAAHLPVPPHGQRPRAVTMYHRCTQLWPEHIESAYRLAIVCSRQKDRQLQVWAAAQFKDLLQHRLRRHELAWRYLRTWRPGCANVGERGYWASWLTPLPIPTARRTRRRHLVAAVRVAQAGQDLYVLKNKAQEAVTAANGGPVDEVEQRGWRQDVAACFAVVAQGALARRRGRGPGLGRLLYEDHVADGAGHDEGRHPSFDALRDRAEYVGAPKHPAANWHLHYNAACFLALAMRLPAAAVPEGFAEDQWKEDCARAAVNQLILSLRAPGTELSKQWASRDKDLEELWRFDRRNHWGWADFYGLPDPDTTPAPAVTATIPPQSTGTRT